MTSGTQAGTQGNSTVAKEIRMQYIRVSGHDLNAFILVFGSVPLDCGRRTFGDVGSVYKVSLPEPVG